MKNSIKTLLFCAAFMIGGVIFQISCSNGDDASSPAAQLNKLIFVKGAGAGQTIWVCDYDGSNLTQVPIVLPANVQPNSTNGNAHPRISPDGQTVFITAHDSNDNSWSIYSCDVSGGNLQEVYNTGSSTTENMVLALGAAN